MSTGVSSIIGGLSQKNWACLGGSRLLLADSNTKNYINVPFNGEAEIAISWTVDLSQLDCGFVHAVYMTPMKPVPEDSAGALGGTLYGDAQGIGFGNGGPRYIPEIDLLEANTKSAQVTLHGRFTSENAKKAKRKAGNIDQDGIWKNVNMESSTAGKWGSGNGIDVTKPINVYCTLKPTKISNSNNYTLKISTTLFQDGKTPLVLSPDSSTGVTSNSATTPIPTYFTQDDLYNMVLIHSLAIPTTTNGGNMIGSIWLDGTITDTTTNKPSKRGPCGNSDYANAIKFQTNINAGNPKKCGYAPKQVVVSDMYMSTPKQSNNSIWVMDYQYRGVNIPTDAAVPPALQSKYNPSTSTNWHGCYGDSHGVCNTTSKMVTDLSNVTTLNTGACTSQLGGIKSNPPCNISGSCTGTNQCQYMKANMSSSPKTPPGIKPPPPPQTTPFTPCPSTTAGER
jgi:hypothetical protein